MRLFVAVYPDDKAVSAWEKFRKTAPAWPLRWTPPSALHFTLKFLGQTDPNLEPKIDGILANVARSISPFSLELQGGDVFKPSVFWCGVQADVSALVELANVLDLELKALGFQVERRPYHPHMTVAKLADRDANVGRGFFQQFNEWIAPFSTDPFTVDRMCLVESRLGSAGSTYFVRKTYLFGNKEPA